MKLIRKSKIKHCNVIIVISTNNPSRFKVKDFWKRNDLFHQLKIFTRWHACRDAIYILNNVSVSRETSDFQARKLVIMMVTKKGKRRKGRKVWCRLGNHFLFRSLECFPSFFFIPILWQVMRTRYLCYKCAKVSSI